MGQVLSQFWEGLQDAGDFGRRCRRDGAGWEVHVCVGSLGQGGIDSVPRLSLSNHLLQLKRHSPSAAYSQPYTPSHSSLNPQTLAW